MKKIFNPIRQPIYLLKASTFLENIISFNILKKPREFLLNTYQDRDDHGEIVRQSPIWIRSTLIGLMGSSIFAIAWLGLAKTEEVVRVSGKLEPKGSVQKIQMPLGGIASDILVEDGEEVKAGQVLMKLMQK